MGVFIYDLAPAANNEAAREEAVIASGALSLMDDVAMHALVTAAAHRFGTRFATVSIIFRDWQYLIAAHGMPTGVTRRSSAFCSHAVLHPRWPFVIPDAQQDERFAENPNVVEAPAIRFYAGAALIAQPDVALGTLCVFDSEPRDGFAGEAAATLIRAAARVTATIATRTAQRRPPTPAPHHAAL